MNKRYAIWDKQSQIITPSGAVFTAEEWMERYPVAKLPNITVLCARGEMNGAFFGTLNSMKELYEAITADALTSIAASLEYQNMLTLEDVGV